MAVKVGDKVKTSARYDVYGTHLASFVNTNTYDVMRVNGSNITIGKGGVVTAVVPESSITNLSGSSTPVPQKAMQQTITVTKASYSDKMTSAQIDSALTNLLANQPVDDEILNYSMRLFGLPMQFTPYCDYRSYSMKHADKNLAHIGRTFVDNIMLEAPVITLVPGKPAYLSGAKNKTGIMNNLLSSSNQSLATIYQNITNSEGKISDKLRYYDFKSDYNSYMQYVNVLCQVSAAFLDLGNVEFGGTTLKKYSWKNYRWTTDNYKHTTQKALSASVGAISSFMTTLKTYGEEALTMFNKATGSNTSTGNEVQSLRESEIDDSTDENIVDALEELTQTSNFVQFYVTADAGVNESHSNDTASSQILSKLDSGSEMMKELAFIAQSGGIDAEAYQNAASGASEALAETFASATSSDNLMSRISSVFSNVIKGDNIIFPEIYQSSSFTKDYSVTVDLRTPYGDRLSYYLNVLVPLWHLLAFTIPKQTTANSYGSPFLLKAYYPGIFSCNLGIVSGVSIEKNPSSDGWTVDGFPEEIKVTLNIKDLYSDMAMTPAGDAILFLSNTSLIEYISTTCGVNLITPQLQNRIKLITALIDSEIISIEEGVSEAIFGATDNLIQSIVSIGSY